MRLTSFAMTTSLALLSSATLAQQTSSPTAAPQPGGYIGAYTPADTAPKPYSTGLLPTEDTGTGLNVAGPDGSTRLVKAVPCSTASRETDGSTTCVGIPDRKHR
jgi:hypothetical protein